MAPPTIRLRGPEDVVLALPYQLGYQPSRSVVVVVVRDRAFGLVARLDLPPPDELEAAVGALVPAALRDGPDAVLLVGYEDDAGEARPVLDALAASFGTAGVDVLDRVVVRGGRWFGPDCTSGCCPPEGRPVPDPASSPVVADYVGLEVAPLPDRASVAGVVAADPALADPVRASLRSASPGAPDRLTALTGWARLVDVRFAVEPPDLEPDAVAVLVRSLADVELRDGLIAWLCPGSLPLATLDPALVRLLRAAVPRPLWARRRGSPDEAGVVSGRRALARLQWLARAVPDEACAAPLTVLAQLAWWLGDGAVARVALERALEHDPGYRLARLLEQMVDLGLRPHRDVSTTGVGGRGRSGRRSGRWSPPPPLPA